MRRTVWTERSPYHPGSLGALRRRTAEEAIRDRNPSREFIELLELLDESYPDDWKIRVVLDNHSSHISKETQGHLATRPNGFEFVFTPKHGSWLNLIKVFFSKMTRSFLRGLRVDSEDEWREPIERYLEEVNLEPVVFRWKY
jgi:transposase